MPSSSSNWHRPRLHWPVMAGVVAACLFALFWLVTLKRNAVKLVGIGMGAFAAYAIWFYFAISPDICMHHLYVPMFLRGFATTMMGITLLYILKLFMHFMVFFQSVTTFQAIHLVIAGVIGAAFYAFGIRYFMADTLASHAVSFDATSFNPITDSGHVGHVMSAMQLATLKRLFGIVAYVALTSMLLIFLWDIPLVRAGRKRIPAWSAIRRGIASKLRLSPR